jgi:hypothetical protein
MYGWHIYEAPPTGWRLWLVRVGYVASIVGWLCLGVVALAFIVGVFASL